MKKYNVVIEKPAEDDLIDIFDYITKTLKAPAAAERIYRAIKTAIMSLARNPGRHSIVRDEFYTTWAIRWLPVENYLVFYIVTEEKTEVHILRVLYSHRDWQTIL